MAGNGDMKAHTETYGLVMGLLKWGTVVSFGLGALVVLLIAG
jgi:Bacterial aa3 type cytochrome c oxidase subunit IV